MKSAILEKGERYYTHIDSVFNAIANEQVKYNWLITDCECYPNDKILRELFSKEYIWISGDQLTEIIHKEDFQFIWGVFSGFSPEVTLKEVLEFDLPFANGNGDFWLDNVSIQHPLADIEIVVWDALLTLLISKNYDLVDRFRGYFPLSEDLSAQNTRDNSEIAHIERLLIEELEKRNIAIDEEKIHKKYLIWNKLYLKREKVIKDEDILQFIDGMLSQA